MRSISLALGASLTWGVSDFFGPLKGRKLGVLPALVYVQLGGLVAIAVIVAIRGKGPADPAVLFAIPAAVSGTLGFYAYYPGLAVGAMSIVALIGIGDMFGNFFFAAASTSGLVSITSVLASLYPIVTVLLARLVLKERVARSQEAGIALTLAGVALISVG